MCVCVWGRGGVRGGGGEGRRGSGGILAKEGKKYVFKWEKRLYEKNDYWKKSSAGIIVLYCISHKSDSKYCMDGESNTKTQRRLPTVVEIYIFLNL